MSTNSTVSIVEDGKVITVYGHWDGNINGVGKTLHEHYHTRDSVLEIINNGWFSSLDANSTDCPSSHTFDTPVEGFSVFYGRDRGENNVEAVIVESVDMIADEFPSAEYDYMFVDGEGWYYCDRNVSKDQWTLLSLEFRVLH